MSGHATDVRAARAAPWAYGWWVVVGTLGGFGIAAALTVGVAFLALGLVLLVVGVLVPALRNRSAVGAVGGLAVAPLYLAWLNRGGPGEVCTTTATSTSCLQEWSPWPFAAVGVALVLGCVVLARRR